ncbi:FecR family protein [Fontimonas sp. SYSU GA230001]|uniref:FecR family protein n=1 Tax=Fontimonas sp. SYSU GA230001 TaxID=3142450 RepID=UPI0032B40674
MVRATRCLWLMALCGGILATPLHAAEPVPAGTVVLMTGAATASSVETMAMRALKKGDPVYAGDIVSAGPNTYVNLKFSDGGLVLVRPNSRFQIEAFSFAAETGTRPDAPTPATGAARTAPAVATAQAEPAAPSRAFFRLLRGGLRTVSGLIGKGNADDYRINTPVATIGIRGTDYWVILCDEKCANDPALLANLPPGVSPQGGVIVGVIEGSIFVINEAGKEAVVGEGQYLITLPDGTQIYLPFEPQFIQIQPIPDPKTICTSE